MPEPQEAVKAGNVYAFTNKGMPYLIKIGKTKYTPEEKRLRCANKKDTYKSPYPFKISMAKHVSDRHDAEQKLHQYFADKRVIPEEDGLPTEFFEISIEEAAAGFATIEGVPWVPPAPTLVRDPSVIGWAGGGKHMTMEEKAAAGYDMAPLLKRNRDMEVSETGREEAEVLDTKCGFNADQKQRGYKVKWELIKDIRCLLGIPNTFTATDWTHEQWKLFTENVLLCKAVERGKILFGYRDDRKGGDRSVSAAVALKSDLSAIFERWSGSSIVNKSITHPIKVKVASSPEMPDYTAWSASERAIIKAEGGHTGNEISSELGVRWKALKANIGYIEPKSVRLNSYSLQPL